MKSIIKIVYKNRGMALPSVIILTTLLLLMIVPLLNLSLQQLKVSKSQLNIGYSYLASGSAAEKAIERIKTYVANKEFNAHYNSTPDMYVDLVIADIKSKVKTFIGANIEVEPSRNAQSILKDLFKVGYVNNGNKIKVTIGFITTSTYEKGINTSSATDVYSQVVIEIDNFKNHFRPAAVNAVGDLYIKGSNAIINGDVKVVGTAPKHSTQFEQNTYGGIYATQGGTLNLSGNAFARAFIRCGNPDFTGDDNSRIDIMSNAVAQCVQIFGSRDNILIYKDAYTFDDLEMNGLNSVIAVNRNYYGLSRGDASNNQFHDASSAIVNSAIIHHPDEASIEAAMKSKIVINGNVMVNGGTFWIDPTTGNLVNKIEAPQIEDVSCAWNPVDEIATYKNFEPDATNPKFFDFLDVNSSWIKKQDDLGYAKGYSNYIQVFNSNTGNAQIKGWFDAFVVENLANGRFGRNPPPPNFTDAPFIQGYCNSVIAANGHMYFMKKTASEADSQVKKADPDLLNKSKTEFESSLYYLSEQEKQDYLSSLGGVNSWGNLWVLGGNFDAYNTSVYENLPKIKEPLMKITEDFVTREYTYNYNSTTNKMDGTINNTLKVDSNGTSIFFDYIGNKLADCNTIDTTNNVVILDDDITDNVTPVNTAGGLVYPIGNYIESLGSTKYYIIAINNPNTTISINKPIRGIVYSRGKVIMANGGRLDGFIIAAGRGYDSASGNIDGSAVDVNRMPFIESDLSNIDMLDNGEFAAVVFEGGTATINFELGGFKDPEKSLNFLLNQYISEDFYSILVELFK
ncbi:MAG TPA: hypothetical protein VIO64_22470 [Pseudobacteroides sp.]|uniref:hypothetical protein n=1 Tax=Pseudobacteroides sp. TaxID=1968840 RepID=UPI002F94C674